MQTVNKVAVSLIGQLCFVIVISQDPTTLRVALKLGSVSNQGPSSDFTGTEYSSCRYLVKET